MLRDVLLQECLGPHRRNSGPKCLFITSQVLCFTVQISSKNPMVACEPNVSRLFRERQQQFIQKGELKLFWKHFFSIINRS